VLKTLLAVARCTTEETLLGALFQRREPQGGRPRLRTRTTTPPDRLPVTASAEHREGCPRLERRDSPLRQGRPLGDSRVIGSPWEAQEATEEVEPRRGQKPMEGTSDPVPARVSVRNSDPALGATPRSRRFHSQGWHPTARRHGPW
jgi:hypothetical protein